MLGHADAMANILLQTTILDSPDDWNVKRFSLLADELARAGHEVTARNRDEATDDSAIPRWMDWQSAKSIRRSTVI